MAAGISDLRIATSKLYLDSSLLEIERGKKNKKIRPGLITKGLGLKRQAINDSNQNPATHGANACKSIIENNKISPDVLARLDVGTESSLDESKGMNSSINGMLEKEYGYNSFNHVGGSETKFACVGGSYALYDQMTWINSGENLGKSGIVVATDTAKYDLGSGGELTQGTGAVAMLIEENPKILTFDQRVTSTAVKDIYDFHRPFGDKTPKVYGDYSELAYLIQVKHAAEDYKKKARMAGIFKEGDSIIEKIDYIAAHIPYPKMAGKALTYLMRHELRQSDNWKKLKEKIGEEPLPDTEKGTIESFFWSDKYVDKDKHLLTEDGKKFMDKDNEFNKKLMHTPEFQGIYQEKVAPSLIHPEQIGNTYTASMYFGLRSIIETEYKKGVDLSGKRILGVSYGSGSNSMVFSMLMNDKSEYEPIVSTWDFDKEIGERTALNFVEYENLHEGILPPSKPVLDPSVYEGEFVVKEIKKSGEITYRKQKPVIAG